MSYQELPMSCRQCAHRHTTMRANVDAFFTLTFIWPLVLLRAMTGA